MLLSKYNTPIIELTVMISHIKLQIFNLQWRAETFSAIYMFFVFTEAFHHVTVIYCTCTEFNI